MLDPRVPFAPFASWKGGRPAGWFDLPMTPEKVQFFKDNGFVVIDNGADPDVQQPADPRDGSNSAAVSEGRSKA